MLNSGLSTLFLQKSESKETMLSAQVLHSSNDFTQNSRRDQGEGPLGPFLSNAS